MSDRDHITSQTVNLGMAVNIMLSIAKTVIGILGHSQALLADGINSVSDVIYYIAVKIFMRQAKKPADSEHPYGHRQLESISAIVVGAFILTTGIAIFFESINKIYDLATGFSQARTAPLIVVLIAAVTLIIKVFLFLFSKRNYRKTNNPTLRALADDHFNDIMAALAVIVGVVMARLGFIWMDPAAGAVVALFIVRTGVSIILESSSELMDRVPDQAFADKVREIAATVPGVKSIEELGSHSFGPYFSIEITICVDGRISVDEGNSIAHALEEKLKDHYRDSLSRVMIHFHPEDKTHA
jgi:cation diffusion facilitator family transporter